MKNKSFLFILSALALWLVASSPARSQVVGIKTNLLYDATATINLGAEVALAPRLSLDVSGNLNLWTWKDNMKWKHWMVQPELRWWTCSTFGGHFFAFHALAGQFNVGGLPTGRIKAPLFDLSSFATSRYQGWAFGAGLGYGYAFPLGKHWNLEAELGLGGIFVMADKFDCDICNRPDVLGIKKFIPSVTKLAINIVYLF